MVKIKNISNSNKINQVYDISINDPNHTFTLPYSVTHNCGEAGLRDKQSCNLTTLNLTKFINEDNSFDWVEWENCLELQVRMNSRITTVTQWHPDWDKVQKSQRLLGVSMTGIVDALDVLNWSKKEFQTFLEKAKKLIRKYADEYHIFLGIEHSARTSLIKPEGCLHEKHNFVLDQGIFYIEDLLNHYKTLKPDFYKLNGSKSCAGNKINKVYKNELKNVVQIKLNTIDNNFHRTIISTKQHKFFNTNRNFISSFNLSPKKDKLTLTLGTYIKSYDKELTDFYFLLGFIYESVQLTTGNRFFIKFRNKDNYKKIKSLFKEHFKIQLKEDINLYVNQDFCKYILNNNLYLSKNSKHLIPEMIRNISLKEQLAFVSGMFCDFIQELETYDYYILRHRYKQNFPEIFNELPEYLDALGLFININEDRTTIKISKKYLTIEAKNILEKYTNLIFNKQFFNTVDLNIISKKLSLTLTHTYDIEVEDSHQYYTGGFLSHNTISQLPTVSSGCHRSYAPYYLRRIRVSKNDPIAKTLYSLGVPVCPENEQGDDLFSEQCNTFVFTFVVKSETAIRAIDESAIDQLERYKMLQEYFVDAGHNCSVTITVKQHEWDEVADWVYDNFDSIVGVSFLPAYDPLDKNTPPFPNMPYEPITEEQYENLKKNIPTFTENELIDLISKVELSYVDNLIDSDCSSGACPIR
jgi:hypothetical protein